MEGASTIKRKQPLGGLRGVRLRHRALSHSLRRRHQLPRRRLVAPVHLVSRRPADVGRRCFRDGDHGGSGAGDGGASGGCDDDVAGLPLAGAWLPVCGDGAPELGASPVSFATKDWAAGAFSVKNSPRWVPAAEWGPDLQIAFVCFAEKTSSLPTISTLCFCTLISRLGWYSCMEIYNNYRHLCFNVVSFKTFLTSAGVDSFFHALMNLLHRSFKGVLLSPVLLPLNPRLRFQPLQLLRLRGPRWSVLPITGAEFIAFLLGHVQDTSPPLGASTADALFKFHCYVSAPGLDFLEVFSDAMASFGAFCNLGFSLPNLLYLHA